MIFGGEFVGPGLQVFRVEKFIDDRVMAWLGPGAGAPGLRPKIYVCHSLSQRPGRSDKTYWPAAAAESVTVDDPGGNACRVVVPDGQRTRTSRGAFASA